MSETAKGIIVVFLAFLQVCLCSGIFVCTIKHTIKIKRLERKLLEENKE